MALEDILGYQLDITGNAALRQLRRVLAGSNLTPPILTSLLHLREHPGCDQTALGRVLAGNRGLGMKLASALEEKGWVLRGTGRDRRSKGLHLTPAGEAALDGMLALHARAEAVLGKYLAPGEREQLIRLLGKVQRAIDEEDETLAGKGGEQAAA